MSKRLRSFSPIDPVKKSRMFDPTLSISLGTQTMGTQGTAIPVTMGGGQIVKAPPVRLKRPKVGLRSKVSKKSNVVVFRYQSQSPWHAANCANFLMNSLGDQQDGTSDNIRREVSGCLYDITCAPNYTDSAASSGLVSTARVRTGNVPVCYRPHFYTMYNANVGDEIRAYNKVYWVTKYDQGVSPSGRESGNCWQLEYLKKPLAFPYETGTASLATVQAGIPNYGTTDGAPNTVRLPPVGSKPILRKTSIQLTLQGESSTPVEYEVMVFAVDPDMAVIREETDLDETKQLLPADVYKCCDSGNTGYIGPVTQGAPRDNEYIKFWTNFFGQYCDDPGCVDNRVVAKYLRPIKSRKFLIDPKTSIENDTIGHCKTVRMDLNWNKIMNYGWRPHNVHDGHPTAQVKSTFNTVLNGPGFSTNIKDRNTFDNFVHPSQRIYLAVRCRQKVIYNFLYEDSVGSCTDPTGSGTFGNLNATHGVTYDVCIRNTFEIDE